MFILHTHLIFGCTPISINLQPFLQGPDDQICKAPDSLQLCGCKQREGSANGHHQLLPRGLHSQLAQMGRPGNSCGSGYSQAFSVRRLNHQKLTASRIPFFGSACSQPVLSMTQGLLICSASYPCAIPLKDLFPGCVCSQGGMLPSNLTAATRLWLENLLKGLPSH